MNKRFKEKFPTWVNDKESKYNLILGDDIDSLLSAIFLKSINPNYEINCFYDFSNLYQIESNNLESIGSDIDWSHSIGKRCWSNHVTKINPNSSINPEAANLNIINGISRENYFRKYCGSTLLQIISYYDIDISKFSEEAKMALLCIDVSFKGYYSGFQNDNESNKYYLNEVLEFPELYNLQQKHSRQDFLDLIDKYKKS